MQRPVMNPTFLNDQPVAAKPRVRWKTVLWRGAKMIGRAITFSPFGRRASFRNEEGTRLGRFIRGVTYRLAFVPLILMAFVAAMVFATTHPGKSASAGPDPLSFGVYYDPVNFVSDDGARLEGWLVPVIDAKRVLEEKNAVIGKRYPAVVLLHDFAGSRHQLLPLVQPLHDAGFVVLAMNLRGTTDASAREAQTFGIKESMDIKAGVEMLRRRAYVDPSKIALVGVGSGANAALIALRNDPAIVAAVLATPADGFDQAFVSRIGANRPWLPPLRPLFRWTFQVMYGVDASELEMENFAKLMETRHVLKADGTHGLLDAASIKSVRSYLEKHLTDSMAATQ